MSGTLGGLVPKQRARRVSRFWGGGCLSASEAHELRAGGLVD